MEIMENETASQLRQLKTLVAILFVLLFSAIGYIWLESTSDKADDAVSSMSEQGQQSTPSASAQDAQVQAIKSSLERQTTVVGRVTSITSDSITINTEIIDLSKLADLDYSTSNDLPTIERSIKIRLTKGTTMSNTPKVDDTVAIETNESVYKSNTTTALTVDQVPNP